MAALRCLLVALAAAPALSGSFDDSDTWMNSGLRGVEELTKATFDERIQDDIILVEFYAPWCGHCKALEPAYFEAAQQLSPHRIPVAKLDATVEPKLASAQGVKGYPTLKIYRKGVASDYEGPRDTAGIVNYMLKQAGLHEMAEHMAPYDPKESPSLIAVLCRDQACNDENHPLIDYDETTKQCHCSAHPCWSDGDKHHSCGTAAAPHLSFSYTKEGVLECGCRATPHHQSKYIALVKCPGEHCEDPAHVVDWDPEGKKCVCKGHPCHDLGGSKHECTDPAFPILHYREENKEGTVKQICECKAGFKKRAADEL